MCLGFGVACSGLVDFTCCSAASASRLEGLSESVVVFAVGSYKMQQCHVTRWRLARCRILAAVLMGYSSSSIPEVSLEANLSRASSSDILPCIESQLGIQAQCSLAEKCGCFLARDNKEGNNK